MCWVALENNYGKAFSYCTGGVGFHSMRESYLILSCLTSASSNVSRCIHFCIVFFSSISILIQMHSSRNILFDCLEWKNAKNWPLVFVFEHVFLSAGKKLIGQMQARYFWPLDGIAFKKFEEMWHEVINQSGGKVVSSTIPVMFGRYFPNWILWI